MTRIVVFGSGGRAGGTAAEEARSRGHQVTALTRLTGDVTDADSVAAAAAGHDVAIAAVYDHGRDPAEFLPAAARGLVDGLSRAGVTRLVWVGLASLLADADGVPLMDTEGYPQEYRSFSYTHAAALEVLAASDLGWTAVSPSGDFDHDGASVGGYRIAPADATELITYADHAIALVDEAERAEARRAHLGVVASG